jgi:hypothetical protein
MPVVSNVNDPHREFIILDAIDDVIPALAQAISFLSGKFSQLGGRGFSERDSMRLRIFFQIFFWECGSGLSGPTF